jgi:hypothetical protein
MSLLTFSSELFGTSETDEEDAFDHSEDADNGAKAFVVSSDVHG